MGVIGGAVGYRLLRRVGGCPPKRDYCSGAAYADRSKIEVLLGPDVWSLLENRVVLDFGCGPGAEAIEMAGRGARKVIGLDIREQMVAEARARAARAGVGDRCHFTTSLAEKADIIVCLDCFEHFADPGGELRRMSGYLAPGGQILIAFGPPWYHPLGGHLFSVFPWAHLCFTEPVFMRWWSEFKSDGATRFSEIDGGLNQMTVRRFVNLVRASGLVVESLTWVPIRRLRLLAIRPIREFVTAIVRCRLRVAPSAAQ